MKPFTFAEIILRMFMSNFNQVTLRSQIDQVRKEPLQPVRWQEFKRISPGAEDIIQFGRSSKNHFRDAVHFWLTVLVYWSQNANFSNVETFFANILGNKYTLCQEISFERFHKLVQRYNFVESDHDFSLHGKFCQAWLVFDVGTEIAILVERDEEFTIFSWELFD